MARERSVIWRRILAQMNQAILLCRGLDADAGTRWFLFGLPGNVYYTVEVPLAWPAVPAIFPCPWQAAVALYDDAVRRDAATLDVARAVADLQGRLDDADDEAAEDE